MNKCWLRFIRTSVKEFLFIAEESVTIQKLKEPSIYSNYMIFKNIFKKKRGNLLSCRNRFVHLDVYDAPALSYSSRTQGFKHMINGI